MQPCTKPDGRRLTPAFPRRTAKLKQLNPNFLELLIVAKKAFCATVNKLRLTYVGGKAVGNSGRSQLVGHVIMLPLKKKHLKAAESQVPRRELAKWVSVTWTGDKSSWRTVQTMAQFTDLFTLHLTMYQWCETQCPFQRLRVAVDDAYTCIWHLLPVTHAPTYSPWYCICCS